MGSGSFPLERNDSRGKKLIEAARLVEEVLKSMYDDVYDGSSGGMQYDNAADDGGALALLGLAKRLIIDEVEKEPAK